MNLKKFKILFKPTINANVQKTKGIIFMLECENIVPKANCLIF